MNMPTVKPSDEKIIILALQRDPEFDYVILRLPACPQAGSGRFFELKKY